jgi:hypothetical protein
MNDPTVDDWIQLYNNFNKQNIIDFATKYIGELSNRKDSSIFKSMPGKTLYIRTTLDGTEATLTMSGSNFKSINWK